MSCRFEIDSPRFLERVPTWTYEETNRIGDHIWWISDVRKFQSHYPNWKFRYGMREILEEIFDAVAG